MHLVPLPALADNYIWLMHDDDGNAIVVDPGDANVVEQALAARQLRLRAILLTHHHPDHVGGVPALRSQHDVPVYAPADERIAGPTLQVGHGDLVALEMPHAAFEVIAIPGHTLSHVAFVGMGVLFCGDTLFSLGCGKLLEGTAQEMFNSLMKFAPLPGDTLVCAGHEYTESNARFALYADPENLDLHAYSERVRELRAMGLPTLPSKLSDELECNPFLRAPDVATLADLRARKDNFR